MEGNRFKWLNDYLEQKNLDLIINKKKIEKKNYKEFFISISNKEEIFDFIKNKRKIFVFGDYDVDGIVSTFIICKCLKLFKISNFYYIPDRNNEGYGLNKNILKKIINGNFDLLILVDNGINSVDEIEYLRTNGIEVIIIDHHKINNDIPNANFIIHPNITDSLKNQDFCASLITFYFCISIFLNKAAKEEFLRLENKFLQLTSLAIFSDMMPLDNTYNYIISKEGLNRIKIKPVKILEEFFKQLEIKNVTSSEINFSVIPCINAVGRLRDCNCVVESLLCEDTKKIKEFVNKFISINILRKKITEDIYNKIRKDIASYNKNGYIFIYVKECQIGLLGLIANKIMKEFSLPILLFTKNQDDLYVGSARSFGIYDLQKLFLFLKDNLKNFGGHKYAGGFSFFYSELSNVQKKIIDYNNNNLYRKIKKQNIIIDKWLPLQEINNSLIEFQNLREPFGINNNKFLLGIKNVKIYKVFKIGKNRDHLKLIIREKNVFYEIIYFYFCKNSSSIKEGDVLDIILECDFSNFKNKKKIQYLLIDYRKILINFTTNINIKLNKIHIEAVPLCINNFFDNFNTTNTTYIFSKLKNEKSNRYNINYFLKIYRYLNSKKIIKFDELETLSYYLNIDKSIILYIIKVFYDLNFVIIKDALCVINDKCSNKKLTKSKNYKFFYKWLIFRNAIIEQNIDILNKSFLLYISKNKEK